MAPSSDDTQNVLELLASIRSTQSKTIERFADHRSKFLRFGVQVDKLGHRVSRLRSTLPSDPASAHVTGLRRDVKEFKADVSGLRGYIDELVAMSGGIKADLADIKTTLDDLQTRFEESDI